MNLDEARLAAHEYAMRHDARYRALMTRVTVERQAVKRKTQRRQSTRRMWSVDNLLLPRAYMHGPRWRSTFDVREVPISEIDPGAAPYHRPGRKLLIFSFESDVRELVQEQVRPGVFAEWSDPYERLPLKTGDC